MKQREYLISDRDADYAVILVKRHRDLKLDDIRAAINSSASDNTIKRAVGRVSGIYWAVEPKIHHTDPKTQAKCVAWASEHRNWTIDQWDKVLWTRRLDLKSGIPAVSLAGSRTPPSPHICARYYTQFYRITYGPRLCF
jgi:hypothetical protein